MNSTRTFNMTFDQYLNLLIQFTEDKAMVLSRQGEAFTMFTYSATIPFAATFIAELGPVNNPRRDQS